MKTNKELLVIIPVLGFLIVFALFMLFMLPQAFLWIGSNISTGKGQYTGTVVETQYHGLFLKTYSVQLKTSGYTPKFEDFCILDEDVYNQLANIDRNKEITVNYSKKLTTASWQCDSEDSSDIVESFKVEK